MKRANSKPEVDGLGLETITGTELEGVSETPDPQTQIEEVSADRDRTKEELDDLRQNRDERKKYAHRIFVLICCWIASLFALLVVQGLGGWWWLRFTLSQAVILAAIGSTTVNVLGIFYIVAHYLFPSGYYSRNSADGKTKGAKAKNCE